MTRERKRSLQGITAQNTLSWNCHKYLKIFLLRPLCSVCWQTKRGVWSPSAKEDYDPRHVITDWNFVALNVPVFYAGPCTWTPPPYPCMGCLIPFDQSQHTARKTYIVHSSNSYLNLVSLEWDISVELAMLSTISPFYILEPLPFVKSTSEVSPLTTVRAAIHI